MKKLNNKGFMLTETLIVSGFVIATLVFLYTQFRTVNQSYQTSFQYNNALELYALGNIEDYLKADGQNAISSSTLGDTEYIDLTTCPVLFLSETEYCQNLITSLNIKKIIITSESLNQLKSTLNTDDKLSAGMKKFITSIRYDTNGTKHRVIAEFQNGTFATLIVA